MRNPAIKYLLWTWMASLLIATMGVSVRQIYCYCVGKTSVSLFAGSDGCQAEKKPEAADCCKKQSRSCCDMTGKVKTDHGCTKKSTKVFQLKAEFLVDKPFEKNLDIPLWLSDEPMYKRFTRPVLCTLTPANKAPPAAPPPCSGRTLCVRHQLFLC